MKGIRAQVAILGAGFGGSLTALLAQRCGLDCVLIERDAHPRFAIGESSTPLANLILRDLVTKYDLPRLLPLTRYGTWRASYPDVVCGPKRGFSFFHHHAGRQFTPRADHANELLVAANPDETRADTQWFRADVDHFLVRKAQHAGIPYYDRTAITELQRDPNTGWQLMGERDGRPIRVRTDFVIDATGAGQLLGRLQHIPMDTTDLRTHSRSLYAHFRDVAPWADCYQEQGGSIADHPFPSDAAALHHVFDGGWMWVLRFDNGVTSAGFCLDMRAFPLDESQSPDAEWAALLQRFPSIWRQFADATPIMPIARTGRLQRRFTCAAGPDWAMLPSTAGSIDALYSTGNAHTLSGIERVIAILSETQPSPARSQRLAAYSQDVHAEIGWIDELVSTSYATFAAFPWFVACSMTYFLAAIYSEHKRSTGDGANRNSGFLMCRDAVFRQIADSFRRAAESLRTDPTSSTASVGPFVSGMAERFSRYNLAGLCDPTMYNMYPYVEVGPSPW